MYDVSIKLPMKSTITHMILLLLGSGSAVENCNVNMMLANDDVGQHSPDTEHCFSYREDTVVHEDRPLLGIEFGFYDITRFRTFVNNTNLISILTQCLKKTGAVARAKENDVDIGEVAEIAALHLYSQANELVMQGKVLESQFFSPDCLAEVSKRILESGNFEKILLLGIDLKKSPIRTMKFFYDHCKTRQFNFDYTKINVTELGEYDFTDLVELSIVGNKLTMIPRLPIINLQRLFLDYNNITVFEPENLLRGVSLEDRNNGTRMNKLCVISLEGNPDLTVGFPNFRKYDFPLFGNLLVDDIVNNRTSDDVKYELEENGVYILSDMNYKKPFITWSDYIFKNPISRFIISTFKLVWSIIVDIIKFCFFYLQHVGDIAQL